VTLTDLHQPHRLSPSPALPGSSNAMDRLSAPTGDISATPEPQIPRRNNQLHQRPLLASTVGQSNVTGNQPALAPFAPGPPCQQPTHKSGRKAIPVPTKLTVLTLPCLDIYRNPKSTQVAFDILKEANNLLSLYTDVQLAFSAGDMGCDTFQPN
jgi:hypothetical protein